MFKKLTNLFRKSQPPQAQQAVVDSFSYGNKYTRPVWSSHSATENYIHYVYACANMNAAMCARIPLRLYTRNANPRKSLYKLEKTNKNFKWSSKLVNSKVERNDVFEIVENHPVLDAINNNQADSCYDTTYERFTWLQICGNNYMYVQRGPRGLPQAIYNLMPQFVNVIYKDFKYIYEFDANAKKITYTEDNIIHLKNFNPNNPVYGMSLLQPCWAAIQLYNNKRLSDESFYHNFARPELLLSVPDMNNQDDFDSFSSKLYQKFTSPRNNGKPIVLNKEIQATVLNYQEKKNEIEEQVVMEIASAFGVPISKIYTTESNYNNVSSSNAAWLSQTIQPLLTKDEEVLNRKFLPMFGEASKDLFLAYDNALDYNQYEALTPDEEAKLKEEKLKEETKEEETENE